MNDVKVQVTSAGPFFYPDIMVVCGGAQFRPGERGIITNPVLIAEVLSPSTAKYDRTTKLEQYQRLESLREYILISQDEPQVRSFCKQADNSWRERTTFGRDEHFACESLGVTVPLSEVYLGVAFETLSDLPQTRRVPEQ